MKKTGSITLSIGAIVILILAIVILSLSIFFIKGMFGKTTLKFEELIAKEPEPAIPSSSIPITMSRETITSHAGTTEAVKVSVHNPTNQDWVFRDALLENDARCGESGDGICYLDGRDSRCNSKQNAKNSGDTECTNTVTCGDEEPAGPGQGECLIETYNCPEGTDPDCAPTEGIRLSIECSQELNLETQTNPKTIPSGEFTTFTALIKIKKGIPKKTYLCKISIVGEGAQDITKDLTIRIS